MARVLHRHVGIGEGSERLEATVEHVDLVVVEIGGVKDIVPLAVLGDDQAGVIGGFQPLIVPSWASKRNSAGADLPFSEITKSEVGL
jgi:hypothetical protein